MRDIFEKFTCLAKQVRYHGRRIKLAFEPRKGVCECCGRRAKGKTSLHHWIYAFKLKEILAQPEIATWYTNELCYPCHLLGNAIRKVTEAKKERVAKLLKLREKALARKCE